MKTSESIAKIAPALLAAQKLIGGAVKDKTGKIVTKTGGTYEYKYSDLASVLDEVKGPLNDNGIILIQSPTTDKDGGGVTVTTRLLHESAEWIEDSLWMPVTQATPQAFGSAITYCRRYQAQSMLGLKALDDDGSEASKTVAVKPLPNSIPANVEGQDLLTKMEPDQRDYLESHVKELTRLAAAKASDTGLATYFNEQLFDDEEQLALSVLLSAPIRAAIKRGRAALRQPLASQA